MRLLLQVLPRGLWAQWWAEQICTKVSHLVLLLGVVLVKLIVLVTEDMKVLMIKISVGSRRDTMIAIIILEIILALIVEVTIDRGLITITDNGIETTTTITEGLVDTTITTIGFSVDSTPLMEHN
jgi:hypothetical protein